MTDDLRNRYARADALLAYRLDDLVPAASVAARWDGDLLRYVVRTGPGRSVEVEVDPTSLRRTTTGPAPEVEAPDLSRSVSPDGRWELTVVGGDLVLTERGNGRERRLTDDAADGVAWASPSDVMGPSSLQRSRGAVLPVLALWSPDSRRCYVHRLDQRAVPLLTYTESVPADGSLRARQHQLHYAMPGDPLPLMTHHVLDVESGALTRFGPETEVSLLLPVMHERVWWDDSGDLYLLDDGRGKRWLRLWRWDGQEAHLVLEETSRTYCEPTPMIGAPPLVRMLSDRSVVWWSERDGWGHLWRHVTDPDGTSTWVQLTRGELQVRQVVALDEEAGQVWFLAGGGVDDESPYFRHLWRAALNGSGQERLTAEPADHAVTAHPLGRWFVDCYAAPGVPPTTVLRDRDGRELLELERADLSALEATGWRAPEEVRFTAADGVTPLWGLLFLPHDLDPAGSYPLLDSVYPGPQMARQARPALHGAPVEPYLLDSGGNAAAWAALGFAVLVMDARSTPLRSRAFHEHSWGRWGDLGLDDHVAAIEQLTAARPYLDRARVGIVGHSGGGYMAARAVLLRPDVFAAAASTCGNHDARGYHAAWGETYHGLVGEVDYLTQATPLLADRLEAPLLLIHGECDDNVPLALTLRLVDALIRADKDVDLLVVPGGEHMFTDAAPWVIRRRWDFLVRHLLGLEPPRGFRVGAGAVTGRYAT